MSEGNGIVGPDREPEAGAVVVVFLRGAADGLNMVAPLGDPDYRRARPSLGVKESEALRLNGDFPHDGYFGLHPKLAALEALWKEGSLAIVHATGSEDGTRSHFEAQDLMEHGGIGGGGWLARYLRNRGAEVESGALAAVALGPSLPECLRGAPAATVLQSLDQFSMGEGGDAIVRELRRLYEPEAGPLGAVARDTFQALDRIDALRKEKPAPAPGADYGDDAFSASLRQVASLVKGRVGLRAAALDLGGWDTHITQETLIVPLMERLARGIAAFHRDLGEESARTTLVVMTEFGRRAAENPALGTEHGRGGVMFVAGGGVAGGRVLADWPGLAPDKLERGGGLTPGDYNADLRVTTNYRDVLAPILERHGAPRERLSAIFPGHAPAPLDLYGAS